ncbi:hypothetical protein [Caproicibacterium sp. BJN0003]|uniref:hypothetical protein n=1 Tax=Caproicibacterium sp. BJN0003 TaxID=2994078 RepID=UPI002251DA2D|nr:hypothetical protein [Caproicibacterium sp. BJN0003]UZT81697.1 hypothetical protein OP489_09415 [Caproicibacterium sp. BJN0003]
MVKRIQKREMNSSGNNYSKMENVNFTPVANKCSCSTAIIFSEKIYHLPDGEYDAEVTESKIVGKNDRWQVGFAVDGIEGQFITSFKIPLRKDYPFENAVYKLHFQPLTPDLILGHYVHFAIKNRESHGFVYSNFTKFHFVHTNHNMLPAKDNILPENQGGSI